MTQQLIVAYTLVDITQSNAVHVRDSNTKEYNQMQNLNCLLQTIGLRTQPMDVRVDVLTDEDVSLYEFDESYFHSNATVWKLQFTHSHPFIWSDGENELAALVSDAHGVAITGDLDETIDSRLNIFDTTNNANLYFVIN